MFAINSLGRRFAVLKLSISAGPAGPDRVLQVESDDLEIRAGCGVQKGPQALIITAALMPSDSQALTQQREAVGRSAAEWSGLSITTGQRRRSISTSI